MQEVGCASLDPSPAGLALCRRLSVALNVPTHVVLVYDSITMSLSGVAAAWLHTKISGTPCTGT